MNDHQLGDCIEDAVKVSFVLTYRAIPAQFVSFAKEVAHDRRSGRRRSTRTQYEDDLARDWPPNQIELLSNVQGLLYWRWPVN